MADNNAGYTYKTEISDCPKYMGQMLEFRRAKVQNAEAEDKWEDSFLKAWNATSPWGKDHIVNAEDKRLKLFDKPTEEILADLKDRPGLLRDFTLYFEADGFKGIWNTPLTICAASSDDHGIVNPLLAEALKLNQENIEKNKTLPKEKLLPTFDINLANSEGYTLINKAAGMGQYGSVEALLKVGANPNKASLWGFTPLRFMVNDNEPSVSQEQMQKTFKALLTYRGGPNAIDPDIKDLDGQTALEAAQSAAENAKGTDKAARAQEIYDDLDAAIKDYNSAKGRAQGQGQNPGGDKNKVPNGAGAPPKNPKELGENVLEKLFGKPETFGKPEVYPKVVTYLKAHPERLGDLVRNFDDPSNPGAQTSFLITYAASTDSKGNHAVVNPVLAEALRINQGNKNKLDLNVADSEGNTPVGKAVLTGNFGNVDALHKAGADLNKPSAGVAPLMLAVTRSDQPMTVIGPMFDKLLVATGSPNDISLDALKEALNSADKQQKDALGTDGAKRAEEIFKALNSRAGNYRLQKQVMDAKTKGPHAETSPPAFEVNPEALALLKSGALPPTAADVSHPNAEDNAHLKKPSGKDKDKSPVVSKTA